MVNKKCKLSDSDLKFLFNQMNTYSWEKFLRRNINFFDYFDFKLNEDVLLSYILAEFPKLIDKIPMKIIQDFDVHEWSIILEKQPCIMKKYHSILVKKFTAEEPFWLVDLLEEQPSLHKYFDVDSIIVDNSKKAWLLMEHPEYFKDYEWWKYLKGYQIVHILEEFFIDDKKYLEFVDLTKLDKADWSRLINCDYEFFKSLMDQTRFKISVEDK